MPRISKNMPKWVPDMAHELNVDVVHTCDQAEEPAVAWKEFYTVFAESWAKKNPSKPKASKSKKRKRSNDGKKDDAVLKKAKHEAKQAKEMFTKQFADAPKELTDFVTHAFDRITELVSEPENEDDE